jgi:histidinol-phosphate phosphatase family protein
MEVLHGHDWYERAAAPRGRIAQHRWTVSSAAAGCAALALRRRAPAAAMTLAWGALTAEFAWSRIAPGPRTASEVATMLATSPLIPPLALWHRLRGRVRARGAHALAAAVAGVPRRPVDAVLFDRDGTLAIDVPYNGDPGRVRLVEGARSAIERLRSEGIHVAAVTNQSGVARGLIDEAQVRAVNRRIDESLGTLDGWFCCFHAPADRCACRKPEPGLVLRAARALGVAPDRCAVIGDTAADVEAAARAGALGVLVPNDATEAGEVTSVPLVASTLEDAVDLILTSRCT